MRFAADYKDRQYLTHWKGIMGLMEECSAGYEAPEGASPADITMGRYFVAQANLKNIMQFAFDHPRHKQFSMLTWAKYANDSYIGTNGTKNDLQSLTKRRVASGKFTSDEQVEITMAFEADIPPAKRAKV